MTTHPEPWPSAADPLGEAPHFLELRGAFYSRAEFTAPFGLKLPLSGPSTCAVSASPPAVELSSATRSSFASVRPARKTFAPSHAKARAAAPPIAPPLR